MDSNEINNIAKPYKVSWYDADGVKQTIRRVPPPRLHDILPTDVVKLTTKRNDDFKEDQEVEVKSINPRHPNVLQLENKEGQTTFVGYNQLALKYKRAKRPVPPDGPETREYLAWP